MTAGVLVGAGFGVLCVTCPRGVGVVLGCCVCGVFFSVGEVGVFCVATSGVGALIFVLSKLVFESAGYALFEEEFVLLSVVSKVGSTDGSSVGATVGATVGCGVGVGVADEKIDGFITYKPIPAAAIPIIAKTKIPPMIANVLPLPDFFSTGLVTTGVAVEDVAPVAAVAAAAFSSGS